MIIIVVISLFLCYVHIDFASWKTRVTSILHAIITELALFDSVQQQT